MSLNKTSPNPLEFRYLGREKAAALIGVSPRTLDRYALKEAFPRPRMIGRSPKWPLLALVEWMESN